jgi:hypothetical protein
LKSKEIINGEEEYVEMNIWDTPASDIMNRGDYNLADAVVLVYSID